MTTLVSFFYQVDTALYLCQFGRIVSVFGIDGCFVEREVQIGTSAFFAHFPFFHLRSDERYVRMDNGKDVQAGQIGGVCMAGNSASAFFSMRCKEACFIQWVKGMLRK